MEKCGYFIGITKTPAYIVAQELGFKDESISSMLIPRIMKLAKEHDCTYIACTPLRRMWEILVKYYDFKPSRNRIASKIGESILTIAIEPQETILCLRLEE